MFGWTQRGTASIVYFASFRKFDVRRALTCIQVKQFSCRLIRNIEGRAIFRPHLAPVIHARGRSVDMSQPFLNIGDMRWKIEQFHRKIKQITGIGQNQCRKARIQRNHIAGAMLLWIRLTDLARKSQQIVYRIKHGLLDDYPCQQLKNPTATMRFA